MHTSLLSPLKKTKQKKPTVEEAAPSRSEANQTQMKKVSKSGCPVPSKAEAYVWCQSVGAPGLEATRTQLASRGHQP